MTVLTAHEIHPTETVNHRGIHTVIIFLNGLIFNLLEHFTPLDIRIDQQTPKNLALIVDGCSFTWIGS